ncbi:MAG: hypothetical protein M1820_003201 [Bogoriella megaspora]|nr:MAG: hypothetical protein M1820_003201 [Bogoriella megaspora]
MVFDALSRLGSKADRVLLYPEQWDLTVESSKDRDSQLLNLAKDKYNAKLQPIQILAITGSNKPGSFDDPHETFDTSITKLLAFNLTSYDRVLHLDNDITLLKNLDSLFLAPPAPIAMPRAYWLPPTSGVQPLTSLLLLIQPNPSELSHLLSTLYHWHFNDPNFAARATIDMDLLNARFGSSALVLPHRPYALLSGEFRGPFNNHSAYLGAPSSLEAWNADTVLNEAALVHFSDWPLPKPWIMWPYEGLAEMQPDCVGLGVNCRERVIWKDLYDGFRERRKEVCALLSVPAPNWTMLKNGISVADAKKAGKGDLAGKSRKSDVAEKNRGIGSESDKVSVGREEEAVGTHNVM